MPGRQNATQAQEDKRNIDNSGVRGASGEGSAYPHRARTGDHEGGLLPRPSPPRFLASSHLHGGPMVVVVGPRATTSVGELTDLGHPSQQEVDGTMTRDADNLSM
jgi:hypothetical protein